MFSPLFTLLEVENALLGEILGEGLAIRGMGLVRGLGKSGRRNGEDMDGLAEWSLYSNVNIFLTVKYVLLGKMS